VNKKIFANIKVHGMYVKITCSTSYYVTHKKRLNRQRCAFRIFSPMSGQGTSLFMET